MPFGARPLLKSTLTRLILDDDTFCICVNCNDCVWIACWVMWFVGLSAVALFGVLSDVVEGDGVDDTIAGVLLRLSEVNESSRCHFELFCKTVFICAHKSFLHDLDLFPTTKNYYLFVRICTNTINDLLPSNWL